MRRQAVETEDQVFDLFNELNEDDDYDIICKRETQTGSKLPRSTSSQQIVIDKMRALAAAHPELLDALKYRRQLEKRYEEEHARRYGN